MENKDRLINLERLNQFKLNLVESKDNSLDITNEDQSKIDIKAKISEEEGNILTLKEDGLYVAPDGALLSTDNSISIEVTDEGTDLTLKKSEEEDNAIENREDGVFVQKYDIATEDDILSLLQQKLSEFFKMYFLNGDVEESDEKADLDNFSLEYSFSQSKYIYCRDNLIKIILSNDIIELAAGAFREFRQLTNIVMPEGLTVINNIAFRNCTKLSDVKIPKTVSVIGEEAFQSCESLASIDIPQGVTEIKNSTFNICSSLANVKLPNSIITIGEYAFDGCEKLKSIDIPDSVTEIGEYAFNGCTVLESINLPEGITELPRNVLGACKALTKVKLPNSITSIGYQALRNCNNLESIEYQGVTYTTKSELEEALENNGVYVGDQWLEGTKIS